VIRRTVVPAGTLAPMRVVITGITGTIGGALAASLRADGHEVLGVSRRPGPESVVWDPAAGTLDHVALEGADAIVHLAGESIDGRWTAANKERLTASRVGTTSLLVDAIGRLDAPPAVLVNGSAMGFYGSRGEEELSESAERGSGFLAELTAAWEAAAAPVGGHGVRLALARTSLVLDPDEGALPRMARITRLFAGGPLGNGRQYWSWITLADEVRALRHLIDNEVEGPVNLATASPVQQRDFAKTLARVLHRPAVMPAPGFAIRAALGQMGQELLLDSIRLRPDVLLASGFSFQDPDLEPALTSMY
jgi:uncharacterized protein (TIGR01777 family)